MFVDEKLAESGLTDASWTPLIYLHSLGDGLLQKELAAASGLDESSFVRLIDILSERGLLERRIDPDDRRARRLHLTDTGKRTASAIRAQLVALEKELLADFSDEDVAAVLRLCDRVEDRIEKAKAEMKAR